ncbi:MAG: DUF167 domain-containing protein [Candidatus Rokubacteria bacterium]|nr:DUF167 domain-containing protein [Candidatus Rokubacteria bacterium]
MTTGAADAATVRLRVQPRASRDEIVGWRAPGVLAVRVTAPPVEGEANRAVTALLASALGIPRSAVTVVVGARGRDKLVRVTGLQAGEIETRLRRLVEDTR